MESWLMLMPWGKRWEWPYSKMWCICMCVIQDCFVRSLQYVKQIMSWSDLIDQHYAHAGNAPWCRPVHQLRQWAHHSAPGADSTNGGAGLTWLGCEVERMTQYCQNRNKWFVYNMSSPVFLCRIKNLMTETPTSYSLLVMFKDVIYAVRDPYGNRPLCIGRVVPISKLHSSGILNLCVFSSEKPLYW